LRKTRQSGESEGSDKDLVAEWASFELQYGCA